MPDSVVRMSASEGRVDLRTAVVWESLRDLLGSREQCDVLDIGGGTGGFAAGVAELGHRVLVVEPNPDALAAFHRRADERGISDRVRGEQGELSTLLDVAEPGSVDVVLCHGVLEWAGDPADALATIARVLRPGGMLSLLVAQQHAAVLARALAGHFHQALAVLDGEPEPERGRRFTLAELNDLLPAAGFGIDLVHGIRVFADHVPGTLLDSEPRAAESLAELERAVAERPEFHSLATQLHVLARLR